MKTEKILIVENEQIVAENLRLILNEKGYINVDLAIDIEETKHFFQKKQYNLVLMDINLNDPSGMDGIDLVKELATTYTFAHIYVTANSEEKTILKAKETYPSSYLIKPFMNSEVFANVLMVLNSLKKDEAYFTVNGHNNMQQQIPLSQIVYIKAEGSYIQIFTASKTKHLARKSLSEFMELFPTYFIRIHKSILINRNYVQAYSSQVVKIYNEKLPLGRKYKEAFLSEIKGAAPFN